MKSWAQSRWANTSTALHARSSKNATFHPLMKERVDKESCLQRKTEKVASKVKSNPRLKAWKQGTYLTCDTVAKAWIILFRARACIFWHPRQKSNRSAAEANRKWQPVYQTHSWVWTLMQIIAKKKVRRIMTTEKLRELKRHLWLPLYLNNTISRSSSQSAINVVRSNLVTLNKVEEPRVPEEETGVGPKHLTLIIIHHRLQIQNHKHLSHRNL